MRTSSKTLIFTVAITLLLSFIAYRISNLPDSVGTTNQQETNANQVANVYGLHVGMTKEDFDQTLASIKKEHPDLIYKFLAPLSDDEKTINGIGIVFPQDKFPEVLEEVIKDNTNKPECMKSENGSMFCTIEDKYHTRLDVGSTIFQDKATGKIYGAVTIVSEAKPT